MSEEKKQATVLENMAILTTPEGIQKYLLGTKKNGQPRAVYDIVKDFTKPKKKKSKSKGGNKKKKSKSTYDFYLTAKKKHKKKHKNGHWHI